MHRGVVASLLRRGVVASWLVGCIVMWLRHDVGGCVVWLHGFVALRLDAVALRRCCVMCYYIVMVCVCVALCCVVAL